MTGWGSGAWGTGPWGSVTPLAPLALESAVAISTKEVQVTINRNAQVIAASVDGDALNPATWTVQNIATS